MVISLQVIPIAPSPNNIDMTLWHPYSEKMETFSSCLRIAESNANGHSKNLIKKKTKNLFCSEAGLPAERGKHLVLGGLLGRLVLHRYAWPPPHTPIFIILMTIHRKLRGQLVGPWHFCFFCWWPTAFRLRFFQSVFFQSVRFASFFRLLEESEAFKFKWSLPEFVLAVDKSFRPRCHRHKFNVGSVHLSPEGGVSVIGAS